MPTSKMGFLSFRMYMGVFLQLTEPISLWRNTWCLPSCSHLPGCTLCFEGLFTFLECHLADLLINSQEFQESRDSWWITWLLIVLSPPSFHARKRSCTHYFVLSSYYRIIVTVTEKKRRVSKRLFHYTRGSTVPANKKGRKEGKYSVFFVNFSSSIHVFRVTRSFKRTTRPPPPPPWKVRW